jgi:hypothetical protein
MNSTNITRFMEGFVAGTLVHTRNGLQPIEQIRVGDCVLSKPEDGQGELSYQLVTRTFEYEDKELYYVSYSVPNKKEGQPLTWDYGYIVVTGGHPIWIKESSQYLSYRAATEQITDIHAWMSVEELYLRNWRVDWVEQGIPITFYAELADGRTAIIRDINPLLQSFDSDIGVAFFDSDTWKPDCGGQTLIFSSVGVTHFKGYTYLHEINTDKYDYTGYECDSEMSVVKRSGGFLPMRRKVYNIQLDNNNTYFVSELSLAVKAKIN